MTKSELRKELKEGKHLEDILNLSAGQDCIIYKGKFSTEPKGIFKYGTDIIYIPDVNLNDIEIERPLNMDEIDYVISECYSTVDFVEICNGHENLARNLFNYVDWQHPDIHDFLEGYDDEEQFLEEYGFSMNKVI